MKRFTIAVLVVAIAIAMPAAAQSGRSYLAGKLGRVLAAEWPCGFRYDPDALRSWIVRHVDEGDMAFVSILDTTTRSHTVRIHVMSLDAKLAMCARTERVARRHGLID